MSSATPSPDKGQAEISTELVRQQLERILASKSFVNAPRTSRFLRYVVEKTVTSPGVHIGEYEIGTEVFDKDPKTFDPRIDNDVRVGGTRLRERLKRFYDGEGRAEPISIEVPPGGFRPVFRSREVAPEPPAAAARPTWAGDRKWLWLAALALMAALASVYWPAHSLPRERRIAVLPFTNVDGDPANLAFCAGLTLTLTGKLTELEGFQQSLWVVPAADVVDSGIRTAKDALRTFGVNLVVTGSVQRARDQLRLTASLSDAATRKQLRSTQITTTNGDAFTLQDELVRTVSEMLSLEFPQQARDAARAGASMEPNAQDFYLQGRGYLQRGAETVDQAIALFSEAIEKDPKFALAQAGLGEAYLQKYENTKDARWIDQAAGSCREAIRINSHLAPVHVTLGLIARASGQYAKAIAEYQQALSIDPRSADAYQRLAQAYGAMDKVNEAEAMHQKAIALRPGYWGGHKDLGFFYYRHGRFADAERSFLRAKDLAPDNPKVLANLGGLYIQLGRYAEAEATLRQLAARQPTAQVYANLGSVYFYQGLYLKSAAEMENAVKLAPADVANVGGLARTYRLAPGTAAKAPPIYQEAIRLARRQLEINPNNAELRSGLAYMLAETGDKSAARNEIQQARELAPDNVYVLFKSVLVYELTGDRDGALKALGATRRGGPLMEEARRHPDLANLRRDPRYQSLETARNSQGKSN